MTSTSLLSNVTCIITCGFFCLFPSGKLCGFFMHLISLQNNLKVFVLTKQGERTWLAYAEVSLWSNSRNSNEKNNLTEKATEFLQNYEKH